MKLRYEVKNKHTKKTYFKYYDLAQVQREGLKELFDVDNYNVISVDIYTGYTDMHGDRMYNNDNIESEVYIGKVIFDDGSFWLEDIDCQRTLLHNVMREDNNTVEIMPIKAKSYSWKNM